MAKFCGVCGAKLGLLGNFNGMCHDCYEQKKQQEQAEKEAQFEEQVRPQVERMVAEFKQKINGGLSPYAYKQLYKSVDSIVDDETIANEFRLGEIIHLGLEGWEIVGVVPRTIGHVLKNAYHQSGFERFEYGGGIGGNVAGVYLILKKDLNKMTDQELYTYARELIVK